MISQTHKLDVVPGGVTAVVHVKQYQTGESLVFELFSRFGDFEISAAYTECTVRGTKSDGNGYSANATCDPSNNSVTVQLTEQMTAVAGRQPYEITITESTGRMITTTFILDVHRAALDADTVESESVIKEVQTIVEEYIEENPGLFVVDPTLTQSGEAADAKKTGDEIADLKSAFDSLTLGVDEDDGLIYIYVNGVKQGEGVESGGGGTRYTVTKNLSHINSSNSATSVLEGKTYTTTLTAQTDYKIKTVVVTMGGVEVVGAYNATTGVVTVTNANGDIVITGTSSALIPYKTVTWLDTAYGIGDNTINNYQGWCPGCAKYDPDLGKVIFLQCHKTGHLSNSTYGNSQLWAIDPYDVMNGATLLHEFSPTQSNKVVPLAFDIYEGTYYVCALDKIYTSSDHGSTWTEQSVVTSPTRMYGLQIIDGVMYTGDDGFTAANDGLYYTSSDYGLNWESHTFDFLSDYTGELTCSEANFIKFNGRIFAGLRREGDSGLLAVYDNGTWEVISDQMPNVTSDTYLFSTDSDIMCFAAIDRPNKTLKIGNLTIDSSDNVTITVDKTTVFPTRSGDFHTPTYVVGPDFNMVTLMVGGIYSEYNAANNIALVGYTDSSLNENPSYTITHYNGATSDVTAEPYVFESPYTNGTFSGLAKYAVVNFSVKYPLLEPLDSNNNIIMYKPNPKYAHYLATSSAYGNNMYDSIHDGANVYCCLVKGEQNSGAAWTGIKIMYNGAKVIVANADTLGGIVPSTGEFDYAFYSTAELRSNYATFTGYRNLATLAE